jgi:hypothetical protein
MPMDRWINFYEHSFPSRGAATEFVEELEGITDRTNPRHRAKVMMHQTQRLISLADDIIQVREGRESLQLLFILICTENIAKLFHNFNQEGQSKAFVRRFFSEFIVGNDRETLESSFFTHDVTPLNMQDVVDCLYSVRCDVVHEGLYWGFNFRDGDTAMLNTDPDITVHIPLAEFRDIVVRGCVRAIQAYAS